MEENMLRIYVSEHCTRTLPHSCILCIQLLPSEPGLHHHLNTISEPNHLASSLIFLGVRLGRRVCVAKGVAAGGGWYERVGISS